MSQSKIEDHSIIAWIVNNRIKNEKGDQIEFQDHAYLYDIYRDDSRYLCVTKSAQCGLSTLEILKNHFDAKRKKMDIIYTLPTDNDRNVFVSGKVNRIIANNPCMMEDTKDKDSIEQKSIGPSMVYYRGTWTAKSAIMVTADRLVHDEKDSSKQDVIADYPARLQHSKYAEIHVFSHPSVPNNGVDVEWNSSDKKEWHVTCPNPKCARLQVLTWSTEDIRQMSIDIPGARFRCKSCDATITDECRRGGRWKATSKGKYSGYHVSMLMSTRHKAIDIIEKWQTVLDGRQTEEYFYNKILGLAHSGSGNVVTEDIILGAVRAGDNEHPGNIVIGVDTGIKLRWVAGNKSGLIGYGEMTDYIPDETNHLNLDQTIEYFLVKFPQSRMVIDAGGDIIGSRKLQAKYPGRVFLCHYLKDRKTQQLIKWGDNDEFGTVNADRNRMIQLVIDEFKDGRIGLYGGTREEWEEYWKHWSHIYRVTTTNALGVDERQWMRSDRDDWVHATVYWRIGMNRFADSGSIESASINPKSNSYMMNPNGSVSFSPEGMFGLANQPENEEPDWRDG